MNRPRVVLDTNVLISAFLFGGAPRQIVELIIAGVIDCSLSPAILDEVRGVLQRPKFGLSPRQAMSIVDELGGLCDVVNPSASIRRVIADPDDDRVLECAIEARADAVVSGDTHLLACGTYKDILILNPSDFLQAMRENTLVARRRRRHKR
jgi:putative PIN family toxin of toxin-antitoxin system